MGPNLIQRSSACCRRSPSPSVMPQPTSSAYCGRCLETGGEVVAFLMQEQSIAECLSDAGYYTIFVRVDTKDFYLTQTRIPGYMVCILKSTISPKVFEKKKMEFRKLMGNLKRPTSAPVEAFLFLSDHLCSVPMGRETLIAVL